MTKDEILVIKVNALVSSKAKERLRKSIVEQKETGVVFLPYFAEAIAVPKDAIMALNDAEIKIYQEV